jgi:Holliday junction resolvase RusA-like endonuclease
VKPWRTDVKHAGLEQRPDGWQLLDGPLACSMVFTLPRPKGHWRTGRNAHLLRDAAPPRPAGVPDLSKLVRATEDALTGVLWTDDARVVEYVRCGKWWAGTAAPDVLGQGGGCVVRVWAAG